MSLLRWLPLICLLVTLNARAAEIKGIVFPEKTRVQGQTLALNGLGVRQKTIFNIDIYVAGLYLPQPSRDVSVIFASNAPKKVVLVFLHDASAQQIADSWSEGLQKNCVSHCERFASTLARLNSAMIDIKKGQEIGLTFLPNSMTFTSRGKVEQIPADHEFSNMMLATFIGQKSRPEDELNKALLGQSRSGTS